MQISDIFVLSAFLPFMKVPLDCAEAVAQRRHWINTIATVACCSSESSWLLLQGGDVEKVGQGVWPRAEPGEETYPSIFFTTSPNPLLPPTPTALLRNQTAWSVENSRAFPLGFRPEVIFHSFNWLLWSPSGQNCENVHWNTASGVLKDSRPFRFCYILL